jgi:endonuclease YncB( thermonuclease family)
MVNMYKKIFNCKIIVLSLLAVFAVASSTYAGNLIKSIEGTVINVSDGDTIVVVTNDGTKVKVRLAGIDTPETPKINHKTGKVTKPGQPYGEDAKTFVEHLVGGKFVRVNIYGFDRYKRPLGFVDGKEINLNFELVKNGLAEVFKGGEYGPYKNALYELERIAKRHGLGMWSLGDKYESPRDFRKRMKIRGE